EVAQRLVDALLRGGDASEDEEGHGGAARLDRAQERARARRLTGRVPELGLARAQISVTWVAGAHAGEELGAAPRPLDLCEPLGLEDREHVARGESRRFARLLWAASRGEDRRGESEPSP